MGENHGTNNSFRLDLRDVASGRMRDNRQTVVQAEFPLALEEFVGCGTTEKPAIGFFDLQKAQRSREGWLGLRFDARAIAI